MIRMAQPVQPHRTIALTMVRQEPRKGSMRVKRKRAGWDNDDLRTRAGAVRNAIALIIRRIVAQIVLQYGQTEFGWGEREEMRSIWINM